MEHLLPRLDQNLSVKQRQMTGKNIRREAEIVFNSTNSKAVQTIVRNLIHASDLQTFRKDF